MLDSLRGIKVRRDRGVGRTCICLNDEETDLLMTAFEPGPPAPEDRRSLPQRRADRLIELLTGQILDRPQLLIHINADEAIRQHAAPGAGTTSIDAPVLFGETEHGSVLTSGALARLACDATTCRILFGPQSQILDLGRSRRLFTVPQRLAITARDRRCRFPGCDRPPRWCDIHHIKHWLNGGLTDIENGILLCRFHHTLVHEGAWTLTGTPNCLVIHDDRGHKYHTTPGPALAQAP